MSAQPYNGRNDNSWNKTDALTKHPSCIQSKAEQHMYDGSNICMTQAAFQFKMYTNVCVHIGNQAMHKMSKHADSQNYYEKVYCRSGF